MHDYSYLKLNYVPKIKKVETRVSDEFTNLLMLLRTYPAKREESPDITLASCADNVARRHHEHVHVLACATLALLKFNA